LKTVLGYFPRTQKGVGEKEIKMRSIIEILKNAAAAVVVHRHYVYTSEHALANVSGDKKLLTALNYSETLAPSLFPLSKKGIEHGWSHGRMLAEAGIKIRQMIGSCQGRGTETAVRIAEGYHEVAGEWIPTESRRTANWPTYRLDVAGHGVGDDYPAQWLNGKRPSLVGGDTPQSFKARVTGLIGELLEKGGINIIATHYEIAVLTHALYVEGEDLGTVPESYSPQNGGGVLIVKNEDGSLVAYDYGGDLNIIE
jgi:broad specificity phosphatase PhoE